MRSLRVEGRPQHRIRSTWGPIAEVVLAYSVLRTQRSEFRLKRPITGLVVSAWVGDLASFQKCSRTLPRFPVPILKDDTGVFAPYSFRMGDHPTRTQTTRVANARNDN
jgi:hypothetical protein